MTFWDVNWIQFLGSRSCKTATSEVIITTKLQTVIWSCEEKIEHLQFKQMKTQNAVRKYDVTDSTESQFVQFKPQQQWGEYFIWTRTDWFIYISSSFSVFLIKYLTFWNVRFLLISISVMTFNICTNFNWSCLNICIFMTGVDRIYSRKYFM